jgi:hypothetical protein
MALGLKDGLLDGSVRSGDQTARLVGFYVTVRLRGLVLFTDRNLSYRNFLDNPF